MNLFSVVIPAYNESLRLPETLAAIRRAEAELGEPVEIIVADNCSTDDTREIARTAGARVVQTPVKCISAVRNTGAEAATGTYVLFIDADNHMAPDLLSVIARKMETGRYIGGGVANVQMERLSLGTFLFNMLPLWMSPIMTGVSMVVFYTTRETFAALGGFCEQTKVAEDFEFGRRMKAEGRRRGQRYCNVYKSSVTVSTRKYDEHGDYFLLTNPVKVIRALFKDQAVLDEFWYRPNR